MTAAWIERGVLLAIGVLLGSFVHSRAKVWGLPPRRCRRCRHCCRLQ